MDIINNTDNNTSVNSSSSGGKEAVFPKLGYRGYTTHRPFGGLRLPVPVQNLVMRDYASRNGLLFMLSINEFDFANCYVQLTKLIKQAPTIEGGLMCSVFMLPPDADTRWDIYREFIRHESSLHFVLESLVVANAQDIDGAEELIQMQQVLHDSPKDIPAELLPDLAGMEEFTFRY